MREGERRNRAAFDAVRADVVDCVRCPRLVAWRETVAVEKRAAFRDQRYWGRPVPGFGDPTARLLVVGLAPAAHGANRTGRMFTGDRSGDWLYAALHRYGFASRAVAVSAEDGLVLRDAFVTSVVKCAPPGNRPAPEERDRCSGTFLEREWEVLRRCARAILCLGSFSWNETHRLLARTGMPVETPRPRFGHGSEARVGDVAVIGSYHPSQQNTFTGRLTKPMFNAVIERCREVVDGP